jgi:hypothetical protein
MTETIQITIDEEDGGNISITIVEMGYGDSSRAEMLTSSKIMEAIDLFMKDNFATVEEVFDIHETGEEKPNVKEHNNE